jgi:hypothetical protein
MDPFRLLNKIRSSGWVVAIHNDYKQNGFDMTFWLFTKPNESSIGRMMQGCYVKGEGDNDYEALYQVAEQLGLTSMEDRP